MLTQGKYNKTFFGLENSILNAVSEGEAVFGFDQPNILNSFSVDSMIKTALSVVGLPIWNSVKEEENTKYGGGVQPTYYVFNYSSYGVGYADDEPTGEVYLIQVHLFAPLASNLTRLVRKTKAALHNAGFTWPETVNASDNNGRHIVFEFQFVDGVDFDGDLYM